jgi:hypothetical protein
MKTPLCLVLGALSLALLAPPTAADEPRAVAIRVARGHVGFLIRGELVGRYHYDDEWSQAKPIFWPLHAPGGVPVTRAWPMEPAGPGGSMDHPHQKSAWFCHGDVIPEGIELKDKVRGVEGVDFWSEAKGHGRIVCTALGTLRDERGNSRLITWNEWRTADGTKILDEARTLSLYELGKARLLVVAIDLSASVCPITFGDTKEGSMGVRVHDALREQRGTGKLENADGKIGESAVWGRRSAWCDYSGMVAGKAVGIALFDDPKNAYPACWHSRGYGLMAANPFGRAKSGFPAVRGQTDLVRLARGEHLRLRYGILLHEGDATAGHVAELYQRFVQLRGQE